MFVSKIALCIATIAVSLLFAGPGYCEDAGQPEAQINVTTQKAVSKVVVLVPDFLKEAEFTDKEGREVAMPDILAADLNFSGQFEARRVHEAKGDPAAWASLDVDYLAQGSYTTDGREIQVTCRVVDAKTGSEVMAKKYPDALRVMRQKVHQMADDVIFQLTGDKGICQTKVAFVSDMTGKYELYVCDYDGHNVFRMTRDETMCLLPGWSPSGNYITFTSYRRMNPDLWWVSASGKSRGILSFYNGLNTAASWSPDGQRIAVSLSKDGNSELYTMRRDGTDLKRLTHNSGIDTSPTWSPNGREIAFNSDRAGTPQVYVMDSEGGNVRRLTYEGKYNASPAWSPSGDKIAYVSRENGLFNIYLMDASGGGTVRLTYKVGHNENPSWSPDGRHIVFSSTRSGEKALYTMDIKGANAARLNIPGAAQTPAWSPRPAE